MITRIHADNYMSLVGFECELDRVSMIMGENGSGKSTVFGLVQRLAGLVARSESVPFLFPPSSATRWADNDLQEFAVGVSHGGADYLYRLVVSLDRASRTSYVAEERLAVGERVLLESNHGKVVLHGDNGWKSMVLVPLQSSAFPVIDGWDPSGHLVRFRNAMASVLVLHMNPFAMDPESRQDAQIPLPSFADFTSWYRHVSQERPEGVMRLFGYLKEVLPGFQSIRMTKEGDQVRHFRVEFGDAARNGHAGTRYEVSLGELSEGQRALIALYSLLSFGVLEGGSLFIDEPDNFLALREVQPWIAQCTDAIHESGAGQLAVISHHPEIIDYLGAEQGLLFRRDGEGAIRVSKPAIPANSTLRLSELEARGWLDA